MKKENKVSSGTFCRQSQFYINFVLSVSEGGPLFSRFLARIFSVINNSRAGQPSWVQRQGRVLTSDNDHHYPDTDTCCSAAVSGGRICSDAERAANHYSDSNTGGANITTLSNIKHPLLTQLTHDSLILHDIIILLESGNPDPVPGLPLTVTVLCVTCKLSLPVMHRAPAPRSSPGPPPPPPPAHRRHPGHILCVLLQQNVTGILIFNRQTGNQSHLHNLSVVPMSHSALAPASV